LPPINACTQLASGVLRRGARRFDQAVPYVMRRKVSEYARLMRSWVGFEAPAEGLPDHVIRYLPRDYELFARLNPGDQYPQAYQQATVMLVERITELRQQGRMIRNGSAEYERLKKAIVPPYDSEQARTISVREAARLQSFPDGFVFCGTMNPAFRQIGNAVPPLMAKALAATIARALGIPEEEELNEPVRTAAVV
jgi:DNA (cytosine-5)-methyltransferase 1